MKRVLLALALLGSVVLPAQAQETRGSIITCRADNIANTLTEMTGCGVLPAQSGATQRYYVGSITAQSTTATAGLFTLSSGTGTNCATTTTAVLSSNTARYVAPANTIAPTVVRFTPPIPVEPGHAICVLGVATNTTTITLTGWKAQ